MRVYVSACSSSVSEGPCVGMWMCVTSCRSAPCSTYRYLVRITETFFWLGAKPAPLFFVCLSFVKCVWKAWSTTAGHLRVQLLHARSDSVIAIHAAFGFAVNYQWSVAQQRPINYKSKTAASFSTMSARHGTEGRVFLFAVLVFSLSGHSSHAFSLWEKEEN